MKHGILTLVLGLVPGILVFAQAPLITLEEAVTAARTSGVAYQLSVVNAKATQALYAKTAAAAGPQLSLTGSAAGSSTTRTESAGITLGMGGSSLKIQGSQTTGTDQSVSIGLNQNLWDGYLGGQTGGTARQASLNLKAAELSAQADLRAQVQSVKQAYYTLLTAQENQTSLATSLAQASQSLAVIQARYEAKQASSLDVQSAKINFRTAEINVREGKASLRNAQRTLANLIGRGDQEFRVAESKEAPPPPTTVEEAVVYALAHRYERTTADLNLQAARVGLDLARATQHPSLNLTASAQRSGSLTFTDSLNLGLSVSWSPWDSGASTQAVIRQESLVQAAEATKTQQDLTIRREVEEAWDDWILKQEKAELSQLSAEKAQAAVAVARAQYQAGTLTNTALLEAEADAMTALSNQAAATINQRLAVLTLKNALGYQE